MLFIGDIKSSKAKWQLHTFHSVSGFVDEHIYFVDGNDVVTTSLFENKKKTANRQQQSLANNCCGFLFLYMIKT